MKVGIEPRRLNQNVEIWEYNKIWGCIRDESLNKEIMNYESVKIKLYKKI
jgi:hypothetical protein